MLLVRPSSPRGVLLTGGTGYLGGLVAATLLTQDDVTLLVPVRAQYDAEGFWGPVRTEIVARTGHFDPAWRQRVRIVELPPVGEVERLRPLLDQLDIREIVHCAGCLDYFDRELLEEVNVGLTRDLLALGAAHGIERFAYLSTAFSSGLVDGIVPEAVPVVVGEDPTEYTRTKREAEWLVADSGLPHLILRPPIVIGDSHDGRYGGKRYGLYQLWAGMERLLFDEWHPEVHVVAPPLRLPLLHQDAFADAFHGALRSLPDGSIFNMVPSTGPDLRQLADLWYRHCMAPERVHRYRRLEDVPLLEIDRRQRAFLGMASTNIRISSHPWAFETDNLDRLRAQGMPWVDTSIDTVAVCQHRFTRSSARIMRFVSDNRARFGKDPEVIDACVLNVAS